MPGLPVQLAVIGASLWSMVTTPPQLSPLEVAMPVLLGSVESPHCSSLFAGQLIAGAVVSTKMIVWSHIAVLPQLSVAVQVRLMPGLPVQLAVIGASLWSMVTTPPQLSPLEVAMPVLLGSVESPHCSSLFAGQLIAGAVVSTKMIVWSHIAVLPQLSVAVQVRLMPGLPVQLAVIGASLWSMVTTPPQLSPLEVAMPVLLGSVESPHCTPVFAGQLIAGAVVSTKMIVWSHIAVLPQLSVAVQVRLMPGLPVQLAVIGASLWSMVTTPPQLSPLEVAMPVLLGSVESPHCSSLFAGQLIAGAVVSTKMIVWSHIAVLPQLSVAVQVRLMPGLPVQLAVIGASLWSMVTTPPQLSPLEVAMPVLLGSVESPHCSSLFAGQLIAGAVVSTKMIVWSHIAVLPQLSVAVQVRLMPGLPVQLAVIGASLWSMVTTPPQLSPLEVAMPVLLGSVESPHCSSLFAGQLIAGAVVSTKMIVWSHIAVLPQLSVAVQVRLMPGLPVQLAVIGASLWSMVTTPPQLSPLEVAMPVLLGSVESPHCSSLFAG